MAEWLRLQIFSALNHSSSHRCGFELSSGHETNQVLLAGFFFVLSPFFTPPGDMSETILTGLKAQIKKKFYFPQS